jgi:hypothetical protein
MDVNIQLAGICAQTYPHPCPLPARGRETPTQQLVRYEDLRAQVTSPLAGEGQGGGYSSLTGLSNSGAC